MPSRSRFLASKLACALAVSLWVWLPTACADAGARPAESSHTGQRSLEAGEAGPLLSHTRLLRRMLIALEGRVPSVEELEALMALPDDDAREAALMAQIDTSLSSVAFYRRLVSAGHDLLRTSRYTAGNTEEGFWKGDLTADLQTCPDGSLHAGKFGLLSESFAPAYGDHQSTMCNDADAAVTTVAPWWAPDTTITLIGRATNVASTSNGADCGHINTSLYGHGANFDEPTCGCGPAAHFCMDPDQKSYHQDYTKADSRHRSAWDQPARLFAHLAWHDLPLDNLIVGDIAVGDLNMRHMDWRFGRQTMDNNTALDGGDWWRPETWTSGSSPDAAPGSAAAWHEYRMSDLDPSRGSDDVFFDPSIESGAPSSMPAAGVLTLMATMSSFPRERVRGARALEIFACRDFSPPPPEVHFPEYINDPATGGPCMACHLLIDPASIHFKRWGFLGYSSEPILGGISHHGAFADHPVYDDAYRRWTEVFVPGTKLTPVTQARADAFPEARFIDFLPPDQTLFGLTSDGTIGPRGFGKLLIESGEFDSCMARRLYEQVSGEKLQSGQDATRIRTLAQLFVDSGRQVRPFLRALLQTPACFDDVAAPGCEHMRGL